MPVYWTPCSAIRVFSKGGFVAVPVVYAAHSLHIPVVTHESDMTPGLANRLCLKYAEKICCNFPETLEKLPKDKAVLTGDPIRAMLLSGDRAEGLRMNGFDGTKPVLMIIGGSLGSVAINQAVRASLPEILKTFDVIHVAGKGHLDETLEGTPGYKQYEYIGDGLQHLYAAADLLISRAGANVICEILALKKPNILIPLPLDASRGDQILNAQSFEKQGFSVVLDQHEIEKEPEKLLESIRTTYENRGKYIKAMEEAQEESGADQVLRVIDSVVKGKEKI